eukprot:m.198348 g.198348  ORF g.198348 m.198348 type:complete len:177 (-) comp14921_c1_seq1:42-572(-)
MEDKSTCVRCASKRDRDKFYVSECGHFICEACYKNKIVPSTRQQPCHKDCPQLVSARNFTRRKYYSGSVHRLLFVRTHLLKKLNLTLENFGGDQRRYNDYLEFKEDLAWRYVNNHCIDEAKDMLRRFVEVHKDMIEENVARAEALRLERLREKKVIPPYPELIFPAALSCICLACE